MSAVPNGFHAADPLQQASFRETGSIPGAAKVTHAADGTLCVRLEPPTGWGPVKSEARFSSTASLLDYIDHYNAGWNASAGGRPDPGFEGFADGFRDKQERRPKWHLTYCPNHGDHEGGCGT